ncbi:MCE family protein [Mycolicibacterium elephantis]
MRSDLIGALWRLIVFTVVGALATFALLMVFAQLRFGAQSSFRAEFSSASGLREGDFVRVAGVEVGKVTNVRIQDDNRALVEFAVDESVVLTDGTRALIRWDNIIGDRFLELAEGAGGFERLLPNQTIPLTRTEPALNLDSLIGGFKPLFRALDPDQLNDLTGQLIQALQGQGPAIGSLLAQTAALTNTVADRDELIGEVIVNLNSVLGSLAEESGQFAKGVEKLAEFTAGLAARRTDVGAALSAVDAASISITDLLRQGRAPLKEAVAQTDRVAAIAVADHEYLDRILDTLPDAYQALARQGLYGDYFSFYVCDLVLKLNGKGGQPVYVKVAGQSSGRCAPR